MNRRQRLNRRLAKYRRGQIRYVPYNYNPPPRFGLRLPVCPECGYRTVFENPTVHLGGGVLAKFGLCDACLSERLYEMQMEDVA